MLGINELNVGSDFWRSRNPKFYWKFPDFKKHFQLIEDNLKYSVLNKLCLWAVSWCPPPLIAIKLKNTVLQQWKCFTIIVWPFKCPLCYRGVKGHVSFTDRKDNTRTSTSVSASAWEHELFILLADYNIKHIHYRRGKGVPRRAENEANYSGATAFPESALARAWHWTSDCCEV